MLTVFLDFGSVTRGDIDRAALEQAVSPWIYHDNTSREQVTERIKGAEIIISNKVQLDRTAIFAADQLKLICVAATGYNNVDLAAAAERNIPVCNVRNYATSSVAQHTLMFMLNFACRFVEYRQLIKKGGWQTSTYFCPLDFGVMELAGKTLGIIGHGELGSAVANIAKAFGMKLLIAEYKSASSIRPGRMAFNDVIQQADFITLHCPLSADTRHLIGKWEFDLMKPSVYLINTARSGLINEDDLLQALYSGRIAGAAIDVLQAEPPVNGNPLLDYPHPNLLITPHSAWASVESRQRMINLLADNIRNFLQNKPFNQINTALQ
ncbi:MULTISPECIES: 2-hydroxyacid dehydrogenase [Nitrosomonas]|uniref:Glycerate dehydrogenase n=2 Tax=Nitrosomonas eutropha TaxID=916 RepID=A0ABX5M8K4_9PROT|nr:MULTISPECIES: 2-hydroxyacid dehydrogenase [Nitrosomonas]ABI60460.1 D-isomer specific 2-hydroxyacid dehydrogenase, NAD-binding protein [Nitrosomonas eutropha C91]MXS79526.1 2-hydroxyacid dehydrogenase [Nitrosomonas sp. GH22]PXV77772.1 glycerate dehydrogenase [Nitrosomonas eutropha]SCX26311.1 glycerate dehydrogenase [Nitrosomonas eutropha]SDX00860.1 glycerate dehydrogenase [Nitrosomonas eutropha]